MRILLISSSPRKEKSSTFILAKEVLKGAIESGARAETVHLFDSRIDFCRHCELCHKKIMKCPAKDDVAGILNKILKADALIIASPNYINQVNAPMKALFDRSAHFIHCKRLLGKYIAGVSTSGSGYDLPVLDYIAYYGHTCAAQYSGGVSSCAHTVSDKFQEAYRLGEKLASDVKSKKNYPEQTKIIKQGKEHFKSIILLRKDDWKQEYDYWRKMGWL